MTNERRRRLGRLGAGLCVAVIAAPLLLASGGAAAPSPAVSLGTLTSRTTITWSGYKGIALATSRQVVFDDYDQMLLFVEGGTFASVSIHPSPDGEPTAYCADQHAGLRCYILAHLLYVKEMNAGLPGVAGRDHATVSQSYPPTAPGENLGKPLELYLMTDGTATLVLKPRGYTGSSSYVAAGRITGHAQKLPAFCASAVACDSQTGYAGYSEVGGATYDLGSRPGVAAVVAYYNSSQVPSGDKVAESQIAGNNVCIYPNGRTAPQASADPEAYPAGCMLVPQHPEDRRETFDVVESLGALSYGISSGLTIAGGMYTAQGMATGKRYLGYQAVGVSATSDLHTHGGFGMWWNYGITDPHARRPRPPRPATGPPRPGSVPPVVPAGTLPATGLPPYQAFGLAGLALALALTRALRAY